MVSLKPNKHGRTEYFDGVFRDWHVCNTVVVIVFGSRIPNLDITYRVCWSHLSGQCDSAVTLTSSSWSTHASLRIVIVWQRFCEPARLSIRNCPSMRGLSDLSHGQCLKQWAVHLSCSPRHFKWDKDGRYQMHYAVDNKVHNLFQYVIWKRPHVTLYLFNFPNILRLGVFAHKFRGHCEYCNNSCRIYSLFISLIYFTTVINTRECLHRSRFCFFIWPLISEDQ